MKIVLISYLVEYIIFWVIFISIATHESSWNKVERIDKFLPILLQYLDYNQFCFSI